MRLTAVIADDSPIQLEISRRTLAKLGFTIVGAHLNGKDAWESISIQTPTIAVLDYIMPHLTGAEVARKVQENALPTVVLLATSMGQQGAAYDSSNGVKGVLIKPFNGTLMRLRLAEAGIGV